MAYTTYKSLRNNIRLEDDEEEQEVDAKFPFLEVEKKHYRQFSQTFQAQHVHFYISKEIGDPEHYTDMIHFLNSAGATDVVSIHLNTPGGRLDTGVQIINAIQNSQAKVITILESTAYSLGSLIFLSGDEMVVNDYCLLMFHNFNSGLIGKGNELSSELEAMLQWFKSLAEDIYVPFLTPEELARITRGEDMWMQSSEIRSRLEKMIADAPTEEPAAIITP
jgi:ATP-dependent Clp protease, protease subunit